MNLWTGDDFTDVKLWSNLPIKMGDSGNYNYNSRYADNLKVVIKHEGGMPFLDTNPSITGEEGSSCFIVTYILSQISNNTIYRMEMIPRYTGGPINIDMYRGIVDLIFGNTFAPMAYKPDENFDGFLLSPLAMTGDFNSEAFSGLMQLFAPYAYG